MKKLLIPFLIITLLIINTKGFSQFQTTAVPCPSPYWVSTCAVASNGWAAHLEDYTTGATINYGDLLPSTIYYLVVEVLPTVPNCATIIVLVSGDGFTDINGIPFVLGNPLGGKDVTSSDYPGRPYKVRFAIKTLSGMDFSEQLYFKLRLECAGNQPYDPYSATRVKSALKPYLLPDL